MLREIKNQFIHLFKDEQDRKQGELKIWHNNGQLEEHCFYIDNMLQGEFKHWYDNGTLSEHCFYVDNVRDGEYKEWWANGQLEEHCFYVNGDLHGEFKQWDEEGELLEHCFHIEGEHVCFVRIPYPNTEEDRMYFKLKYDLQLLPVEQTC